MEIKKIQFKIKKITIIYYVGCFNDKQNNMLTLNSSR